MNDNTARDAIIVGLFFIAYGVLTYVTSGLPARLPDISIIDPRKLEFALRRRAEMIEQEHSDASR